MANGSRGKSLGQAHEGVGVSRMMGTNTWDTLNRI
jgi:hypothetical protein